MKIVDGSFQLTKEEVVALHNYEKGVVTDSLDEARERAIAKMIDGIKESVKKGVIFC